MNEKEKELEKVFDRLASYNLDGRKVFETMLDFIIFCTTISDETDEKFPLEIQDKIVYKDKLLKDFSGKNREDFRKIITLLGEATACPTTGKPIYYDTLGKLFMTKVSYNNSKGRNDQYFTPQYICDLMVQFQNGKTLKDGQLVNDPTCGSSRFLLSMAKINPNLFFCGSDIDHLCVKMSVVNLIINGLEGEIVWGNPLTFEGWKTYQIKKHYGIPIVEIKHAEKSIHFREKPKQETKPKSQLKKAPVMIRQAEGQLTLNFD